MSLRAWRGGRVFDGATLREGVAACFVDGVFAGWEHEAGSDPKPGDVVDLEGDILSPGYVDLQVNGGDGVMFNDAPTVATLRRIAEAHRRLGAVCIIPTLITDSRSVTEAAIAAARDAITEGVPGIAGLHLEGPHLSEARKGAHDAKYIRPMEQTDLAALVAAKRDLPVLKITLAPENVQLDQVRALADAGILVSLGHTDADYETCLAYAGAGARCATHLFNAMSQLGNRTPGLVGAALDCGTLSAGMIADGIHIHPATMRAAWAAKTEPGGIFLVSDAMAVAGTDLSEFRLDGRVITRHDRQLRLADGTLAGADLDLTRAVSVLVETCHVDLEIALQAATIRPAQLCGLPDNSLQRGVTRLRDMIRIKADLSHATPLEPDPK